MIFKEPENQIKYLKYSNNETSKGRHFKLNVETLENLNELIAVLKKQIPKLNITSDAIANIIFKEYFKTLENKNDMEIINEFKKELLKEV